MLGSIFEGTTLRAARVALTGLTRRQEAISSNVANIDTADYQRRSVSFEEDLAAALRLRTDRTALRTTDARHFGSASVADARNPNTVTPREVVAPRNDANEVSIDEEMALLAETQLRYQALTSVVSRRLGTLRGVIRG
jgi:flagellar basal-body rod protein FlgB